MQLCDVYTVNFEQKLPSTEANRKGKRIGCEIAANCCGNCLKLLYFSNVVRVMKQTRKKLKIPCCEKTACKVTIEITPNPVWHQIGANPKGWDKTAQTRSKRIFFSHFLRAYTVDELRNSLENMNLRKVARIDSTCIELTTNIGLYPQCLTVMTRSMYENHRGAIKQ